MTRRASLLGALAILCAIPPAQSASAQAPTGMPVGASSINETYEDWRVVCVQSEQTRHCAVGQVQTQSGGQRLLAIELKAPASGKVTGTVALPFGLSLDRGAQMQIDDTPLGQAQRFRTCLPTGCLIDLDFDSAAVRRLRGGQALRFMTIADGGDEARFTISLRGFGQALDRAAILLN